MNTTFNCKICNKEVKNTEEFMLVDFTKFSKREDDSLNEDEYDLNERVVNYGCFFVCPDCYKHNDLKIIMDNFVVPSNFKGLPSL